MWEDEGFGGSSYDPWSSSTDLWGSPASKPREKEKLSTEQPSRVFSDNSLNDILNNFYKEKQRQKNTTPPSAFREVKDVRFHEADYSNVVEQPQSKQAFRQYREWEETGKFHFDEEKLAKDNFTAYSQVKDNFYKEKLVPFYEKLFFTEPTNEFTAFDELEEYFKDPNNDATEWGNYRDAYLRVRENYKKAENNYLGKKDASIDFRDRKQQVDPAFRRAYQDWSTNTKYDKGTPVTSEDKKKALFLENWDMGLTGDENDPLFSLKGLLKQKYDPKATQDDFMELMEEHKQADYLSGAGFQIPPSKLGKVGGISNRLRPDERKFLFLKRAKQNNISHMMVDGVKKPIDDMFFDFKNFTDKDEANLELMDKFFNDSALHNKAVTEYWANVADMSPEERKEAQSKNKLLLGIVKQRAVELEANGLIDEAYNRSESLNELGRLSSWTKTGTLAAKSADLLQNAIAMGGDVPMSTWQQLSEVTEMQQDLEEHKEKEGYSALAEIQKLEQEEGTTGWMDTIGRWLGNPEAIVQTAVESFSSLVPAYLNTAPETIGSSAAAGALTGTILPGAGTVAGAVTGSSIGAKINYGIASGFLEASSKVIEVMNDMGIDTTDPNQLAGAWANPTAREEIREKALKKSVPIAIMDGLSAGLAGKTAAIFRQPTILKKLPSSLPGGKKYYKGLSDKASDELGALKKKKRKSGLNNKETEREKFLDSKVKGIVPTESAFSRAARLSDSKVHRYTKMQRAKNAGLEMGTQMAFGAGGEVAGQLWSRDPGDPLDKNAVMGEIFGELGGIGTVTSALEIAGKRGNPLSKKEEIDMRSSGFVSDKGQEIDNADAEIPYKGTMYQVDRAGWVHPALEVETAGDATGFIAEKAGIAATIENPDPQKTDPMVNPQLQVMEEYIQGVMNLMKASPMTSGKLKIAITDRTPDGNKAKGYTQVDQESGDTYVYLNPQAAKDQNTDIMGAAIHEFPHILGKTVWGEAQILKWYSELTGPQQRQTAAHYLFKDEVDSAGVSKAHIDFNKPGALTEAEEQVLGNYMSSTTPEERAMEWFSFEYARTLLGGIYDEDKQHSVRIKKADPDSTSPNEVDQYLDMPTSLPTGLNKDILTLVDRHIAQPYMKYIGSGARNQSANIANPTIENRMAGQYVDDKGKPSLSSNAALRPEKMGIPEMYAIILEQSGWMKTPDNKLKYVGPDKVVKGLEVNRFGDLTESRNKLLDEAQHVRRLSRIVGLTGPERVQLQQMIGEKGEVTLERTKENPKGYETQGFGSQSKADTDDLVETELSKMEAQERERPFQPADRTLQKSSDIGTTEEEIGVLEDEYAETEETSTRTTRTPLRKNEELSKARQERISGSQEPGEGQLPVATKGTSYNKGDSTEDSVITGEKTTTSKGTKQVTKGGTVYRDSQGRAYTLGEKKERPRPGYAGDEDDKGHPADRRNYLSTSEIAKIKFNPGKETAQRLLVGVDEKQDPIGEVDQDIIEESSERGGERLLKRMGLRNLEEIHTDISKMLKEGTKRGLDRKEIWQTVGYKRLLEERTITANVLKEAKSKVKKDVSKVTDIPKNKSPKASAEELITRIEERRTEFRDKFDGATPEQKIKELKKLLKSNDKKFMESTKDIVDKLKKERGRFTEEEFLGEVARSFGLDEMADTFKTGRSKLNLKADQKSVTEAYALAEELVKNEIELLDTKKQELSQNLRDTEGEIKTQTSEWGDGPKLAEFFQDKKGADGKVIFKDGKPVKEKKTVASLDDKQLNQLVDTIKKAAKTKDFKTSADIKSILKIENKEAKEVIANAILNLNSVLPGKGIDYLKTGKSLAGTGLSNDQIRVAQYSVEQFQNLAKTGAILRVQTRPENTKALKASKDKAAALKTKIQRLDNLVDSIGVGSATQTAGWKNIQPQGKDMFGYFKKVWDSKTKTNIEVPITLGDLTGTKKMDVYRKNYKGIEQKVPWTNPANELKKHLDKNLGPEGMRSWGDEIIGNPGQTYGDYALALLHAEAAIREGEPQRTEHGTFETHYFQGDSTNIVGALATRIKRLRENIPQALGRLDADVQGEELSAANNDSALMKRRLEAERAERLEGADLEHYNRWRDMQSYDGAWAEELKKAQDIRDEAVAKQTEKSRLIDRLFKTKDNERNRIPISQAIDTVEKVQDRTIEEDELLQDLKDFRDKIPKTDTKTGFVEYLKENRLTIAQRREDKDKVQKLPLHIAAEDKIILNIANTKLSQEMFGVPSSTVGQMHYNRDQIDYQLSVEKELDDHIADLQHQVEIGGSPMRAATIGQFFKKDELFKHGSEFRRATQDFVFSRKDHNKILLNSNSKVVDRLEFKPNEKEITPHTPEESQRIKDILESAVTARQHYLLHQFDFTETDILNADPSLDIDGSPVSYSHLIRLKHENLAYNGPSNERGAAYGDNRPGRDSTEHKDPIFADPDWGGTRVTVNGKEKSWNEAYKEIAERQRKGEATEEDAEILANLEAQRNKFTRGRDFSGTTSGKLFGEVIDALNRIKEEKGGLTEEEIDFVEYDPRMDRSYNLALRLRQAITRGDKRLPKSVTTVRINRGGKWIVETDIEKILQDEDLKAQWFKDNAFLAKDFVHHFDNLAHKSDPVISATNSIEDNNMVKNMFHRQALEEAKDISEIAKRGYTKEVSAGEMSSIQKDLALAQPNASGIEGLVNLQKEFNSFVEKLKSSGGRLVYSENKIRNNRKLWVNQYPILGLDILKGKLNTRKGEGGAFINSGKGHRIPVQMLLEGDEFFINDHEGNHQVMSLTQRFKVKDENMFRQAMDSTISTEERIKRLKKALNGVKFRPETQNKRVLAKDKSWQSRKAIDEANLELAEMRVGLNQYKDIQKRTAPPGKEAKKEHRANVKKAVQKAEDNIRKLELEIKSALNFLKTGEGTFSLGDTYSQDGLLMEHSMGGWGIVTDNEMTPASDKVAAILDRYYLDEVHQMDHSAGAYVDRSSEVQDNQKYVETRKPSARQQLSSFTVTPRQVGDFLMKHGLGGANKIAGSHSKWHAETDGGILGLKYLDGTIDEMLNDMQSIPARKIERLTELKNKAKNKAKIAHIDNLIAHQLNIQESFKNTSPADRVMLEHFSMLMENVSKDSVADGLFSESDKKVAQTVFEGKGDAMSVAIAQSEIPYSEARIVNLGVIEETKDGRKIKTPIRGLLTPAFKTAPDAVENKKIEPRKITYETYEEEAGKGRSINETVKVVDSTGVVESAKKINLIPISSRWPVDPSTNQKKSAYVYDIKILRTDRDVATAAHLLIKEKFDNKTAEVRDRLVKFEELHEQYMSEIQGREIRDEDGNLIQHIPTGVGQMTEEQIQKLAEKKTNALAIKQKQEDLENMFSSGNPDIASLAVIFDFDNLLPKKKDKDGNVIKTPEGAAIREKVKYSSARKDTGINLQEAKLRALGRMVVESGGVRHDTKKDVKKAQEQTELNAKELVKGGDQSNFTEYNPDDAESSEGAFAQTKDDDLGAVTDEELVQYQQFIDPASFVDEVDLGNSERWIGTSMSKFFTPTSTLKKLAARATRGYSNWDSIVKGEKDLPKDGFLAKRAKSGYVRFVEQFAAFESLHPEVSKAFGIDKNSDEAERINVYSELYSVMGKTGDLMDQSSRELINPIGDAMYESKVDQEKLGNYLIALVAPQVNRAAMNNHNSTKGKKEDAPVDANGKPNGSGMTDDEANARARQLEGDINIARFIAHKNKPINKIFAIHQKSLQLAADSGMIGKDQYDKMLSAAKDKDGNFRRLPFKGMWWLEGNQWAEEHEISDTVGGASRASGKGLDQSRKAGLTPGTKGRKEGQWADPMAMLENTIQMHQEAVIRSQRLGPANMLIDIHNKLKESYEKDKDSYQGRLWNQLFMEPEDKVDFEYAAIKDAEGKETGQMTKVIKPAEMNDTRFTFYGRKDGEPIMIKFNNKTQEGADLAAAAKNLNHQQMTNFMEGLNFTTQLMGKLVTSWNPEFWLRNPVRDTSAVFFNMGDSPEGKKARKRILSPKKFFKQTKAIAKYENYLNKHGSVHPDIGDGPIDIARVHSDPMYAYHHMKAQGGKTAFYVFKPIADLMKDMAKILKEGRSGKGAAKVIRALGETIDMINVSLENAYRVRVFAEMLHDGVHIKRAVREARNATVDFNKRGVNSRALGTFLLFSNPTIQGSKRSMQAFAKRGPKGAAQAGFGIFLTFLSWSTIARALSQRDDDEEDDGSTYYDDRGNIKNSSSIGIPLDMFFEKSTGRHFDLPVDFSWTPIVGLADLISKQLFYHGSDKHAPNLVGDLVDYVVNSSVAIAPNPADLGLPILEPLKDVWFNKKSFGGMPIYNEGPNWNPASSPEEMSTNRTSQAAKALSNYINRAGGGTEKTPGNWLQFMGGFLGLTDIDSQTDLKDPTFKMGSGVSAPVLSYLLKEYTNGLGEAGEDMANLLFFPGDTSSKKYPLVNALLKPKTSDFPTVSRYYEMEGRARSIENLIKHWQKAGQSAKVRDYYRRFPEARKLITVVKAAKRNFEGIKRQSKALDQKNVDAATKMQRLDILQERRINTMRQALVKAHKHGVPV